MKKIRVCISTIYLIAALMAALINMAMHRRVSTIIADTLADAPNWDTRTQHEISRVVGLVAGLLVTLIAVWLWTTEMPLTERAEIVLRPLERLDATVIAPLGLHLDMRWLMQGVLGGIALYGPPLIILLRQ